MRSFRSRSVDDHTAALARARVAHVAGRRRAGGADSTIDDVEHQPAWPDLGSNDTPERPPWEPSVGSSPAEWPAARPADPASAEAPVTDLSRTWAWRVAAAEPPEPADAAQPTHSARRAATSVDSPAPGLQPADPTQTATQADDPVPMARFGRLGLERVQLAVIVLVVLVGGIGATVLFLLARPEVVPIEPELVASGTPADTGAPAATSAPTGHPPGAPPPDAAPAGTPAPIIVHVAGLVARPGVVELPSGSRVVDAIEAAGGATPEADLTPINLARVLSDGEQVLVTSDPPPAALPAPPAGVSGTATPSAPVNLNTATASELETLPGIGPALAGRILDWRAQNGRFSTIDELREVAGIGDQRFAQLQPLVTL